MSTKNSLALVEWNTKHEIHIYKEMLDDCYYLETENGKLAIPGKYAKEFAKVLNAVKKNGM